MKYICLGYLEPGTFEGMIEDERRATFDECFEHNDHLRANGLDEFREALRIRLEAQRARINRQLELVTANREQVMWAIREAEAELERIRYQ